MQNQLQQLKQLLPKRHLKISRLGRMSIPFLAFSCIVALAVVALIGSYAIDAYPSLQQDYQLSQDYRILDDANIKGECKSKNFIAHCKGTVYAQDQSWQIDFSVPDFSTEKQIQVEAVQSVQNPNWVTLDIAIENLYERIAGVALSVLIGLCCLCYPLLMFRRYRQQSQLRQAMEQQQPWQFILRPASFSKVNSGFFATISLTYCTELNGREQKFTLFYGKSNLPIQLDLDDEVLMLAEPNQRTFVPVSRNLAGLELSKEEKTALKTALKNWLDE